MKSRTGSQARTQTHLVQVSTMWALDIHFWKFSRRSKCNCGDTSAYARIKIDVQESTAQNAHKVEWFLKNNSLDTDAQ